MSSSDTTSTIAAKDRKYKSIELPKFSNKIEVLLQSGKIYQAWDIFIEECSYHILDKYDFSMKHDYADFGRLMHQSFPCIEHDGIHPCVI